MKILIICQKLAEDDDLLGAFVAWVRAMARHVSHVDILCLGKGEYELPDNCRVYSLGKERGVGRVGRWINFMRLMFKLVPKCDVTFSHMSPIFSVASWPFVKLYGKKASLWYAHGTVSWKLKLAEKCVDIIFTSTSEGCRISSDKIKVVGQGIDVDRFRPVTGHSSLATRDDDGDNGNGVPSDQLLVTSDKFKIVSVGRIAPSKDYETMIRAVERLVREGVTDFEVKVLGRANLKEHKEYFLKIKQMVDELKLDDYIKFVGAVPNKDVVKYYQEADLFLNMSQTGSLDRAIVEAMACGCPILTCNEAAVTPLKNVGLGWLMYGKRNYEQLAKKIKETKKLETKKLGEIGQRLRQEVVEEHSVERLGEKITDAIFNF